MLAKQLLFPLSHLPKPHVINIPDAQDQILSKFLKKKKPQNINTSYKKYVVLIFFSFVFCLRYTFRFYLSCRKFSDICLLLLCYQVQFYRSFNYYLFCNGNFLKNICFVSLMFCTNINSCPIKNNCIFPKCPFLEFILISSLTAPDSREMHVLFLLYEPTERKQEGQYHTIKQSEIKCTLLNSGTQLPSGHQTFFFLK